MPGKKEKLIINSLSQDVEESVRDWEEEGDLYLQEFRNWDKNRRPIPPDAILLKDRPEYWTSYHYQKARLIAREIGLHHLEAEKAIEAFFGPREYWKTIEYENANGEWVIEKEPLFRTDEQQYYGPSIAQLLAAIKHIGGFRFAQIMDYLREQNIDNPPHYLWPYIYCEYSAEYDYQHSTTKKLCRINKINHEISRRKYKYWKLIFNLHKNGIKDIERVPYPILKGLDKLSGASFIIARALLRKYNNANLEEVAPGEWRKPHLQTQEFWNNYIHYKKALYEKDMDAFRELPLSKSELWRVLHNRVPQKESVRRLPRETIMALAKPKKMQYFLRLLKSFANADEETDFIGHDVVAAANLSIALGDKAIDYVKRTGLSLHDAGINLPSCELTPEQITFLFKYAHKAHEAQRVINSWNTILEEGVNPNSKNGLQLALQVLSALKYENVQNIEFAQTASEVGVQQYEYTQLEKRWVDALEQLKYQTIPAPRPIVLGEFMLRQLDKTDPRAVFVGEYTGCCQHPRGVGKSCAWHSHESPHGAVWAIEKRGKIIAEAWVWRHENALVLDNIEVTASIPEEQRQTILRDMYEKAASSVLGRLGIKEVYVGTGYADIVFKDKPRMNRPFNAPVHYSDSHSVWLVAEKKHPFQEITPEMIQKIKRLEKEIYPEHLQEYQNFESVNDLLEYVEFPPYVYVWDTGYAIWTENSIDDIASISPLSLRFIRQLLGEIADTTKGNVLEVRARDSTSWKILNFFVKKGIIEIVEYEDQESDNGEVFHNAQIRFTHKAQSLPRL